MIGRGVRGWAPAERGCLDEATVYLSELAPLRRPTARAIGLAERLGKDVQQGFRVIRLGQETLRSCTEGSGLLLRVRKTAGGNDANEGIQPLQSQRQRCAIHYRHHNIR